MSDDSNASQPAADHGQAIVHTPGPWQAKDSPGAGWIVQRSYPRPGYTGLAPICSMAWFQFPITGIISDEISEANARLIATAPDLLEFAEMFVNEWEATWTDPDEVAHEWTAIYHRAKELIRVAKGGHSVV